MKIIFFGNTKFSLIGAKIIHEKIGISQIVTIPDHPDKRGRIQESPLKTFGKENNLPVIEANKITEEIIEQIANLNPDFFVVEDYGLILPAKLLAIPTYAALNIHHSLLPNYRGSSPAPTALLNGDKVTGVTIMKMTEQVDAGDILTQKEYEIKLTDTTESLLTILNELGAKKLVEVMNNYESFSTNAKKQDESKATFTKMMKKQDGYIDLNNLPHPEKLDGMIRAYFPWPTVWTRMQINGQEKMVKFLPDNKIQVEGKKTDYSQRI